MGLLVLWFVLWFVEFGSTLASLQEREFLNTIPVCAMSAALDHKNKCVEL